MKIILASKSGVRKKILEENKIDCEVHFSNVDEGEVKKSLTSEGASPLLVSKNLAELKSIKVSKMFPDRLVLGADSVVSLNDKIINKPTSRKEAYEILKRLNNSEHFLISSVCISKNGSMIWNYSDSSKLTMKKHRNNDLRNYLEKINTKTLLAYGVYQVEAGGMQLFSSVEGDKSSIMGLPIKQIINYIKQYKNE